MSEEKSYLVTLKPFEPYFFGKEKWHETGNKSDFFQRSSLFPQQTALLGMLRHFLLLRNDKIVNNRPLPDAWEVVGEKSFDVVANNSFGRIKKVSPVFIRYADRNYMTTPKDWGLGFTESKIKTSYGSLVEINHFIPFSKEFDPKKEDDLRFIEGGKLLDLPNSEKVFTAISQPGITKNKTGMKDDKGFYRQEYVSLHRDCSLAFYATIADEDLNGFSDTITMGGQRSPFLIQFTEDIIPDFGSLNLYSTNQPSNIWSKLVLLSDTFIFEDIIGLSDFAITDSVSFRNISSKLKGKDSTRRFSNLKIAKDNASPNDQQILSGKYFLLEKGSVFFFKDEEKRTRVEKLITQANFQNIGYNIFQIQKIS